MGITGSSTIIAGIVGDGGNSLVGGISVVASAIVWVLADVGVAPGV